jgi:glycosyltransferase involved in cell wall biosynthesis
MENEYPLVSVIVPTYNRPEFLKKTLMSILNQSYKYMEIFVVSNEFSDKNKKVVEAFNDIRLQYMEQKNSGGPSSPRNNGIKKAKGKYIAFCDDDDIWMSKKIEKQVAVLEKYPQYGLSYTKMVRFNDEKEWAVIHEEGSADLNSLLYVNTVPISSVLIKKSLLDKYGNFSESKKVGTAEDYEFLLRHAVTTKFYFINEYLIKYWSGNDRMTENQMGIRRLYQYLCQVFNCYGFLLKSKKIKVLMLFAPALYNIRIFTKSVAYQVLLSMKVKARGKYL